MAIQYAIFRYAAGPGPAIAIEYRTRKDAARLAAERMVWDMLAADALLDRPVALTVMDKARNAIPDKVTRDGKYVVRLQDLHSSPCVVINWIVS